MKRAICKREATAEGRHHGRHFDGFTLKEKGESPWRT
jgi:hypothetical protein